MIKKIIGRRGIKDLPVTYIDRSRTSPNYFQIVEFPQKFTAGKNIIKLRINGGVLAPGSTIQTEILDGGDAPIYHEILNYVEQDGTRVIVVYIYPDTPPGIATVYIAARATRIREIRSGKISYSLSPQAANFRDYPNVKWKRTIPVQPGAENTSGSQFQTVTGSSGRTLKLFASPTTVQRVPDSAAAQGQGGSGELIPKARAPFGQLKYTAYNRLPVNSLSPPVARSPLEPFISAVSNSAGLGAQVMKSQAPLDLPGLELPKLHSAGFKFEPDMVGGKITIPEPITIRTPNGLKTVSASYEATIVKLRSEFVADVTNTLNFTYTNPDNGQTSTIHGFEELTNWTASYSQKPNFFQTQNSQSYANIIISNLMPATGDVARIRVYQKAQGAPGDFTLVNETPVQQEWVYLQTKLLLINIGKLLEKVELIIQHYYIIDHN